jgi:DNA modification methylase
LVQLIEGDCLEVMPTLPDKSVDAIIADWPYGTTACKWDSVIPLAPLWAECKRVIKDRGAIVLFGSQPFTSALVMSNPQWFKYAWVWNKVNRITGYLDAKRRPLRVAEDILVFCNGQNIYNPQMTPGEYFGTMPPSKRQTMVYGKHEVFRTSDGTQRYPLTLLNIPADERGTVGRIHPTQKPVALLEYLIRTYTNEGETVLDNTMGSGSTLIACMNTGRNGIGIEKDPGYFQIAKQRIEKCESL